MREPMQTVPSDKSRSGKVAPQMWRTSDGHDRTVTLRRVKPAPKQLTRADKIRNMRAFA